MFQLKSLSRDAIPRSLEMAERYRLLNEPAQAESICLDVLRIDPENQRALITLFLSLTDQFDSGPAETMRQARELLTRLRSPYDRAYYEGILYERQARAILRTKPGSEATAYQWLRRAMQLYEEAEALRSPGNDNALLRWNACARLMMKTPRLLPAEEPVVALLE
ncbi:MAG: hypothetical protein ACE147_01185 [Candidatus Methylomirabilales bacterium]